VKKVKFGILIRGPAGSGKTTLARRLLRALGSADWKIGIVRGDDMSLVIWKASFDQIHLSLKYDNVTALTRNICHYGYNIIIDDLVRRDKDFRRIQEVGTENAEIFIDILLEAPFKVLLERQKDRDLTDFVGIREAKKFYCQSHSVSRQPDLTLNTHKLSEQECLDRILKFLKSQLSHQKPR